eukprot:m.227467 g.227467  ORF g.227467 m.227467 type:complete len:733 (-) comp10851_c3_seq2:20-2218(-)
MSGEVVSCSDKSQPSLQEAFARFRKARKDELQRAIAKESEGRHRSDAEVDALRAKFLEQALSYQGIPYAQRYHEPGSKFHDAPLFLDCCGLVRRVLRDLKEDFGFDIGRWNQAYQFDTLPIAIDDPKDMKPGDLVFISGDYFHKDKQQIHRMTHVEIWMGDGEKTLGARWQRGVVEIHDSYKFVSKSYGNMEYHFRSIDTWLQGVCVSHCPEHKWQTVRAYRPTKNSIFSLDDADESICDDDDDADEGAGDDDDDDVDDMPDQDDQENQVPCDSAKGTPAVRTVPDDSKKGTGAGTVKLPPIGRTPTSGRTPAAGRTPAGGRTPGAGSSKASTASGGPRSGRGAIARASSTPQYFVGGHNGDSIINEHLAERGWTRVTDAKDTKFFFKWVELKRDIVYDSFRPGKQIINRNPRISCLTTKINLLDSLRAAERTGKPTLPMSEFVPETYKVDDPRERREFFKVADTSPVWICKPTGMNQGKGIFLIDNVAEFKDSLEAESSRPGVRVKMQRIVQRYIPNPLVLDKRKFDVRAYMLIASVSPPLLYFHDGYCRLSCEEYCDDVTNVAAHLTNQYVQKRHPRYQEVKDDTVWSMDQFNDYVNEHNPGFPRDYGNTVFRDRMQLIMRQCFESVRRVLDSRDGFFDLLGFDFMVDTDMKVWLIEVNVNPALHTNCEVLRNLIPFMAREVVDIALEVHERKRTKATLSDLDAATTFVPLLQEKAQSPAASAAPKKPLR